MSMNSRLPFSHRSRFSILLCIVILSGCMTSKPETSLIETTTFTILEADEDTTIATYKVGNTPDNSCAPREGDVADTKSIGFSLGFLAPASEEDVEAEAGKGAVGLGGRNPEVLIARELLYRACELSSNINADKTLTKEIYFDFLSSIETITANLSKKGPSGFSKSTSLNPELVERDIVTEQERLDIMSFNNKIQAEEQRIARQIEAQNAPKPKPEPSKQAAADQADAEKKQQDIDKSETELNQSRAFRSDDNSLQQP